MASNTPEASTTSDSPESTAASTFVTVTTTSATRTTPAAFTPPLTTPWTRPTTCAYTYDVDNPPTGGNGPTAFLDWHVDEGASTFSCYPSGMFESGNWGTFSPASCPFSWYTVDNFDSTKSAPHSGTMTRTCCSQKYTLRDGYCEKAIPTVLATPVSYVSSASTFTYMSLMTTYLVNATVAHHPMVILFQEKDQDILGIFDDDLAQSDTDIDTDPLSIGAKVGIGIGAAVCFSLMVGVLVWLLRRRRRSKPLKASAYELGGYPRNMDPNHCESLASTSAESVARGRHEVRHDADPPPAYEPSPRQTTPVEGDVDGTSSGGPPEEELRALKAQQEAIQRRIQELEGNDER